MSGSTDVTGPRPGAQAAIGVALVLGAVALWLDAARLPAPSIVGIGPSAALRLVGGLLLALGLGHLVSAARRRGLDRSATKPGNRASLGWVLGALAGLLAVLHAGGGFVLAAAWLFVATARAFGERFGIKSIALGIGLSATVYLFFTRALSLALPAGPIERVLLGG